MEFIPKLQSVYTMKIHRITSTIERCKYSESGYILSSKAPKLQSVNIDQHSCNVLWMYKNWSFLIKMTQLTCLLTLQGARSLRSAATRAGLLQLRRPVSTQPPRPRAVKANADTTKLSNEEASALGASKKPPGSNPGSFMHQQSNLNTKNNK